ncbi:LLM class flavin-dependent oxidoreductase [uncultured Mycobacterium sp.]|uniref:LLM class flavin-dependent oxidoreductase n=1 Tax=uncultured Mycobacterium sp. TaxID=171292 RepID=UPI0035CA9C8B
MNQVQFGVSLAPRTEELDTIVTLAVAADDAGLDLLGSIGPRALELTGRVADGWAAPIPNYLAHEDRGQAQDRIDAAARAAGRDPRDIRRLAHLPGIVTDGRDDGAPTGNDAVVGPAQRWVETIAHFVRDLRYDTVIFRPDETSETQLRRFTDEVVPGVRATLGAEQN